MNLFEVLKSAFMTCEMKVKYYEILIGLNFGMLLSFFNIINVCKIPRKTNTKGMEFNGFAHIS